MQIHLCAVALTAGVASAQLAIGTGGIAEIWNTNCASCHHESGKGGGAGTRSMLDDEWAGGGDYLSLFKSVKHGMTDSGMPAYGETMSDAQCWALVVYLTELREKDFRKNGGGPKPKNNTYTSDHARFETQDVVTEGLKVPWALDFFPDGRMILTNRPGAVKIYSGGEAGGTLSQAIEGTPKVFNSGQGGMMDVAVHPDFARDEANAAGSGWIYLAYSDPRAVEGEKTSANTKVVRGRVRAEGSSLTWVDQETIYEASPATYSRASHHFGSRLAFSAADPDGKRYLFLSHGERGTNDRSRKPDEPQGKIHRVLDDGSIPGDNPFIGKGIDSVWSVGHRNPQALVMDDAGGLWSTEHSTRGGDEFNLIERGRDYGWSTVCFGMNYNGSPHALPWLDAEGNTGDIAMPLHVWMPSTGVCGMSIGKHGETLFPGWAGDFFAGGLSGENIWRLRVADGKVTEREEIIHGIGRVRDVATGLDGAIYVVLNDPDKVIRLVPAK